MSEPTETLSVTVDSEPEAAPGKLGETGAFAEGGPVRVKLFGRTDVGVHEEEVFELLRQVALQLRDHRVVVALARGAVRHLDEQPLVAGGGARDGELDYALDGLRQLHAYSMRMVSTMVFTAAFTTSVSGWRTMT